MIFITIIICFESGSMTHFVELWRPRFDDFWDGGSDIWHLNLQ